MVEIGMLEKEALEELGPYLTRSLRRM